MNMLNEIIPTVNLTDDDDWLTSRPSKKELARESAASNSTPATLPEVETRQLRRARQRRELKVTHREKRDDT